MLAVWMQDGMKMDIVKWCGSWSLWGRQYRVAGDTSHGISGEMQEMELAQGVMSWDGPWNVPQGTSFSGMG